MLHDRILVSVDEATAEQKSKGGILIPATAQMGKRVFWAVVRAAGPNVRQLKVGDRVLFDGEDRAEVEVCGMELVPLRERDVHAVAQPDEDGGDLGLYL